MRRGRDMLEVVDAYQKAMEAWAAVPKIAMLVRADGERVEWFCGECGQVFATYVDTGGAYFRPSFEYPIFCCGRLLT